jgi:hypothetical protein
VPFGARSGSATTLTVNEFDRDVVDVLVTVEVVPARELVVDDAGADVDVVVVRFEAGFGLFPPHDAVNKARSTRLTIPMLILVMP